MKKLALFVTAVLLLFLAGGCQDAAPKRVEQIAEGMIMVNGPVKGEPAEKIYGERDPETGTWFPLDAAMVFCGNDKTGYTGAGTQNLTSNGRSIFVENDEPAEVWSIAAASYKWVKDAENKVYIYDVHADKSGVWFRTSDLIQVVELHDGDTFRIKREASMVEMSVSAAVPAVTVSVSCRKGEQELAAETLRVEEMQNHTDYPLPEGTDRVEVVTYDAEGKETGRATLKSTDHSFPVPYDIGGQFLEAKTLAPQWK